MLCRPQEVVLSQWPYINIGVLYKHIMFEHDAGPLSRLEEQIAMSDGYTITHLNANESVRTRCCYGPDSCNPSSNNFFFYICCWNCMCPCLLACLTEHIIDIWASLNFYYNIFALKLFSTPFWALDSTYRYFYVRAIVFTHRRRPRRYHCCCQAVCHLLRAV